MKKKAKLLLNVMTNLKTSFFIIVLLVMTSCQKTIIKKDIYGVWTLVNNVDFRGNAWGKLEIRNNSNIWIDPCINDTMYHYSRMDIKGDSLILTDYLDHQFIYTIQKLQDSTLVITNFKDASCDLQFKKIYSYSTSSEGVSFLPMISYSAKDLPQDSLDVIIKTADIVYREYEDDSAKTAYILNHAEMEKARGLLDSYITNKEYLNDGSLWTEDRYPLPFNEYVRQYMAYKQNGHLIVHVNLMADWVSDPSCLYYTSLKKDMWCVHDGGPRYASAEIDLTKEKVIFFMTNGVA
ncbi:MAG: hypothetical protein J6I31_00760 [Prevotella sp.]|nr:hypothetical protein [Prevotella sp.]